MEKALLLRDITTKVLLRQTLAICVTKMTVKEVGTAELKAGI